MSDIWIDLINIKKTHEEIRRYTRDNDKRIEELEEQNAKQKILDKAMRIDIHKNIPELVKSMKEQLGFNKLEKEIAELKDSLRGTRIKLHNRIQRYEEVLRELEKIEWKNLRILRDLVGAVNYKQYDYNWRLLNANETILSKIKKQLLAKLDSQGKTVKCVECDKPYEGKHPLIPNIDWVCETCYKTEKKADFIGSGDKVQIIDGHVNFGEHVDENETRKAVANMHGYNLPKRIDTEKKEINCDNYKTWALGCELDGSRRRDCSRQNYKFFREKKEVGFAKSLTEINEELELLKKASGGEKIRKKWNNCPSCYRCPDLKACESSLKDSGIEPKAGEHFILRNDSTPNNPILRALFFGGDEEYIIDWKFRYKRKYYEIVKREDLHWLFETAEDYIVEHYISDEPDYINLERIKEEYNIE